MAEIVLNVSSEAWDPFALVRDKAASDPVNHPAHYTAGKLECLDAIEGLGLPYHEGTILKYLVRWRLKGGVEDLKKARFYLDRLIANAEKEQA